MIRKQLRFCISILVVLVVGLGGALASSCNLHMGSGADGSSPWQVVCRDYQIRSLAFCSSSVGWAISRPAAGGEKQVRQTDDGGRSWRLCTGAIESETASLPATVDQLRFPVQVLCVDGRVLLTCHADLADDGGSDARQSSAVLASSDGGKIWRPILDLASGRDSVLWLSAGDADHLWALCGGSDPDRPRRAYLLASSDGGDSWRRLPKGAYGVPSGTPGLGPPPITFVDSVHGWSLFRPVAYQAEPLQVVSTTADGGRTWQVVGQPIREEDVDVGFLLGFCALDAQRAWCTLYRMEGMPSVLASTLDGGRTWVRASVKDAVLAGVYFDDASHGWVVAEDGDGNVILGTRDGGERWTKEFTLSDNDSVWATEQVVFGVAGDSLFVSNGRVLVSRSLPGGR